jgi:hypothetical protein
MGGDTEMYIPHYLITIIALLLWWHYCVIPAIREYQEWKARRPTKPPSLLHRLLRRLDEWSWFHFGGGRWERLRAKKKDD